VWMQTAPKLYHHRCSLDANRTQTAPAPVHFGCGLHPKCTGCGAVWVRFAPKLHRCWCNVGVVCIAIVAVYVQFGCKPKPNCCTIGCGVKSTLHSHDCNVPTTRIQQSFPLVHNSCGHHSSCTTTVCIMKVGLIGMPSSCPCAACPRCSKPDTNDTADDEVHDMNSIMSPLVSIRFMISM
jgi:hypothetical protein